MTDDAWSVLCVVVMVGWCPSLRCGRNNVRSKLGLVSKSLSWAFCNRRIIDGPGGSSREWGRSLSGIIEVSWVK